MGLHYIFFKNPVILSSWTISCDRVWMAQCISITVTFWYPICPDTNEIHIQLNRGSLRKPSLSAVNVVTKKETYELVAPQETFIISGPSSIQRSVREWVCTCRLCACVPAAFCCLVHFSVLVSLAWHVSLECTCYNVNMYQYIQRSNFLHAFCTPGDDEDNKKEHLNSLNMLHVFLFHYCGQEKKEKQSCYCASFIELQIARCTRDESLRLWCHGVSCFDKSQRPKQWMSCESILYTLMHQSFLLTGTDKGGGGCYTQRNKGKPSYTK